MNPDKSQRARKLACTKSAFTWAYLEKIILPNDVTFDCRDRPYLIEPMKNKKPVVGCMKATGGGFSISVGLLPSFHGLLYSRYPQGVGHYFPTDKHMRIYVKSSFDPMIRKNTRQIGQFVKTGRKGTDSAEFKTVNGKNLFLFGATITPTEEGAGKAAQLFGFQFDRLVPDETDQMEPAALSMMTRRMDNACVDGVKGKSEIRYIANPSDVDWGIDLIWQPSNQMYWFVKCLSCGHFTCPVDEFLNDPEGSIGIYKSKEAKINPLWEGYVRCSKCGRPIRNGPGEYVAKRPEVKDLDCYQWSHLCSLYVDPAKILYEFRHPPFNNLANVYRLHLGLPYSPSENKLRVQQVYQCCGFDAMSDTSKGPCAIGVDIGKPHYFVIGVRTDRENYEILKVGTRDELSEIHDLCRKFNVKSGVLDIGPEGEAQRQFQKNERFRIYLCRYNESPVREVDYNNNTGVVSVFRTGIFDKTHRLITEGKIKLPRQCRDIDEFARQCCLPVKKRIEQRTRVVYRYVTGGDGKDHYRNALNYFVIAASGSKLAIMNENFGKKIDVDNSYKRI